MSARVNRRKAHDRRESREAMEAERERLSRAADSFWRDEPAEEIPALIVEIPSYEPFEGARPWVDDDWEQWRERVIEAGHRELPTPVMRVRHLLLGVPGMVTARSTLLADLMQRNDDPTFIVRARTETR